MELNTKLDIFRMRQCTVILKDFKDFNWNDCWGPEIESINKYTTAGLLLVFLVTDINTNGTILYNKILKEIRENGKN